MDGMSRFVVAKTQPHLVKSHKNQYGVQLFKILMNKHCEKLIIYCQKWEPCTIKIYIFSTLPINLIIPRIIIT